MVFLAVFGLPRARENDPEMAIRAGVISLDQVLMISRDLEKVYKIDGFQVRIEINTGLVVTGPLEAVLWVASSTPSTDFTAKLVDVEPSGYARNLPRRYHPPSAGRITPGSPPRSGSIYGATSNLFKTSHCLRLEISSSNFLRFDRNLTTWQPAAESSAMQTAQQTILHESQHPSRIILPTV